MAGKAEAAARQRRLVQRIGDDGAGQAVMHHLHRLPDGGDHRGRIAGVRVARSAGNRSRASQARQGIRKDGDGFARRAAAHLYGATHRPRPAFHKCRVADQDEWRHLRLLARQPCLYGDIRPDAGRLAKRQCQGKRRCACRWQRRAHL